MIRVCAVVFLNCLITLVTTTVGAAEDLDYHVTDPELKVVRLDSSPDDSFLSVRTDSEGRIFVGGRKTLFAYDLDEQGGYQPRKLLFEFPDHSWVSDIEVRGDDLYVVTVTAVYRIPDARVKRHGLQPERLLWGVPNGHVHQCFHACAWGPEGDLYVSMGDPLWYYGDFTRPDHWGHWTFYYRPSKADTESTSSRLVTVSTPSHPEQKWAATPYNGVGGIFCIRPDGTSFRSFARGLRNPCGLCFDRNWHLFTNDNDHEGIPSLYAPGRLMHVVEGSYWSWPRGWMQSKTPDRADILPMVNEDMGRAVPVLQTYYADGYLPEKYENNLLVTRWCRRTVSRFPLERQGATFTAREEVLLEGRDQARPVGICVGRGGRVFVTVCYMAQNEGSPTYRSDLAVITRREDPESLPFQGYDVTQASAAKLEAERSSAAWWRKSAANVEVQRREDSLAAPHRKDRGPLSKEDRYREVLQKLTDPVLASLEQDPEKGVEQIRGLRKTSEGNPMFDQQVCLRLASVSNPRLLNAMSRDADVDMRMAGVLSAGFRLTMPPVDAVVSADAPLAPQQKEESNIILYADEKEPIDLRKLGRVGNYTVAEHWQVLTHTEEQERLFGLLMDRLVDKSDRIRLQAAHFLSLLNDPRAEERIASVVAGVQDRRLDVAKLEHVKPIVWMLGPVPDSDGFQKTVHPVETQAIDLAAKVAIGGRSYEWTQTGPTSPDRPLYDFLKLFGPAPNSSVYSLFRFESPTAQRMQLLVGSEDGIKVWHNGKLIFKKDVVRPLIQLDDVVPLDLQPGSNDILVRVGMKKGEGGQYLHYRHLGGVRLTLPEKPDGLSLAERLKSQPADGSQAAIDPKFVQYDWPAAVLKGDVARGRKLFGAESLGCAKCHAATSTQAGGGGPSLTDAGKRFTLPYLVESVLAPSKVVSPVFRSSVITTNDGKVITGLVVSETGEKIEVLQPDTKRITIEKANVDERKFGDVSAMPVGLVKTPEELRDVVAYLLSNPQD